MAQQDDLRIGDVVVIDEEVIGAQGAVLHQMEGVITRVLDTDPVVRLYVVDIENVGLRFKRRSALTFAERPRNLVDEWDNNALMQRLLADPVGVFTTFELRNKSGSNSAA